MGTGRELRPKVSVFLDWNMTFRRTCLFAVALFAVGCAALPNGADDITCLTADANCAIYPGDGSTDATFVDGGFPTDAGVATAPARSGLCAGSCSPDDPKACVDPDAGADAATATESCRVVLGAGQKTEATCSKAGTGGDGASCTSGADCKPGFECVGTGTCRAYCCDDSVCTTMTTNNQSYETFFCDVASEHASSGAIVPVCNVVQHCALFTDQCNVGEACTIVEINSGSSLVATCDAVGDAKLNESCETAHCAAGFACIGTIGQRTCQQLCDTMHPCPTSSSCNMKSQALMQYKVGICGP